MLAGRGFRLVADSVGAAVMLYFLLRVTGIPPTEARALASRGDDDRQYQRPTSAFIPWFPKREEGSDGPD